MSNPRQVDLGLHEGGLIARVDDYRFEPIRGYPMLQWAGKRPFTSTQYYPAQLKEVHGPEVNGWRNKIFWGDNLQVMSHLLKEFRGQVQLIYLDPPFDSKADYTRKITVRGQSASSDKSAFEEKQYTDIWTNDEYLQFMYERLILLRELLVHNGSLYLHCDWHKSHYLRIILDEIFGPDSFVNEIVWQRTNSHNLNPRYNLKVHDTILLYGKSTTYIWNDQFTDYSPEQLRRYKPDESGRLYKAENLTISSGSANRNFEWRGSRPPANRGWALSRDDLEKLWAEGRILTKADGTPRLDGLKVYLDEMEGKRLTDLWTDIGRVGNTSEERLDYPTQKPEALLERIIRASSNPGGLVFDCFMGSGTTQTVAMKLGRRFIGADINLGAVQIATKRLLSVAASLDRNSPQLIPEDGQPETFYTGFEVYNVNHYDIFRNPVEARNLLLQALEVNPLPQDGLFDGEKDGRMIKLMPINRIATRQDLNELIYGLDRKVFERRQVEAPGKPVEKITLVCMGHESDLAALLQREMQPYQLDVEVVDILRDRQDLQFKRDAEAQIAIRDGYLLIEAFYPMNLLSKLGLQQEYVEDWRELVDSIMIDWNYDGAVLQPTVVDVPEGDKLVAGRYRVPADAGTIRVKITDVLSESLETELHHG